MKLASDKNIEKNEYLFGSIGKLQFATLLICFVILLCVFSFSEEMAGDSHQYVILAKSILQGSYNNDAFIGSPPEVEIPPGYPLLITPVVYFFKDPAIPLKLLSFVSMLLALFIILKLFQKHKIPPLASSLFVIALSLNPGINVYSHLAITESLYILFTMAAIYFFDSSLETDNNWKFIGASVVVVSSYFLRPLGAALIIGAFLLLVFRKNILRTVLFVGTTTILYCPWFIRNLLVKSGNEESFYLKYYLYRNPYCGKEVVGFGEIFVRIAKNIAKYSLRELPTIFTGFVKQLNPLNITFGAIFSVIALIGTIMLIRKKKSVVPFFVIFYAGAVLLYSTNWACFRFIVPIAPLIIILIWKGLNTAWPLDLKKYSKSAIIVIPIIAIGLNLIHYVPQSKKNISTTIDYLFGDYEAFDGDPGWRSFYTACKWIEDNTPPEAGVICRKPRICYHFSGRKSQCFPYCPAPEDVIAKIESFGADYVLVDARFEETERFLIPTIEAYPDKFSILFETDPPVSSVYKIRYDISEKGMD
ncbi:MAG: glycosyltransferase family 39 protein [bacterium]